MERLETDDVFGSATGRFGNGQFPPRVGAGEHKPGSEGEQGSLEGLKWAWNIGVFNSFRSLTLKKNLSSYKTPRGVSNKEN